MVGSLRSVNQLMASWDESRDVWPAEQFGVRGEADDEIGARS